MELIIGAFPSELKTMIGDIQFPEDDGLSVSENIVKEICVTASNGGMIKTFQNVRGGFGYILGNRNNRGDMIEGTGVDT